MTEHIIDYHIYLVELYEKLGDIETAKHHLKLVWLERALQ